MFLCGDSLFLFSLHGDSLFLVSLRVLDLDLLFLLLFSSMIYEYTSFSVFSTFSLVPRMVTLVAPW